MTLRIGTIFVYYKWFCCYTKRINCRFTATLTEAETNQYNHLLEIGKYARRKFKICVGEVGAS